MHVHEPHRPAFSANANVGLWIASRQASAGPTNRVAAALRYIGKNRTTIRSIARRSAASPAHISNVVKKYCIITGSSPRVQIVIQRGSAVASAHAMSNRRGSRR